MTKNNPIDWKQTFERGLACTCPRCGQASIYKKRFSMTVRDTCPACALDLTENDSADGPAFILIFILGFIIVPLALIFEWKYEPALWVHAVIWTILTLGITLGSLRHLKSLVIAMIYKADPDRWETKP